ncbi:MAG: nucleoside-diphosphate sugar epimerase [Bradyrhizobium sp.]|nr:MAG: nucleoside-diphosphate sugar epimerase [Bradyrhizobium sp.]
MGDARIGEGVRVLILGSGKAGHEINAIGVAEALGGRYEQRRVDPRKPYLWMSPFGPVDPRDAALFDPPWPDIVLASGRVTTPYLRAFKRKAGSRLFAVFLQDPRFARRGMDLIWVPEHDRHRGPNVIATLTSPHPFSARRLAAARAAPDPRLAALPAPRCAIVLGGPSGAQHFTAEDETRMSAAVRAISAQGFSIMATPSRRTPPSLLAAVRAGLGEAPGFVWDGAGDNPYASILALADALLVTGDSANMVGEATVTGAPVYVFEPSGGGSSKLAGAIDALARRGAVRRFDGRIERFTYAPIDSSGEIAGEIVRRFALMRAGAG